MNAKALPVKNSDALITIEKLFSANNIPWQLVGGSNLFLQEVPVEPHDIDILIPNDCIEKASEKLSAYAVEKPAYRENDKFRSYFGKFIVANCEIEIMSDLEVRDNNGTWIATTASQKKPVFVELGNVKIPCTSLETEYEGYILMGKDEKAKLIMETINKLKIKQGIIRI